MFFDIEAEEVVTIEQLEKEFSQLKATDPESFNYSFNEYITNCLASNNGTLESIK